MAPPRLPQQYVAQLTPVLAALPAVAQHGAAGRQAFLHRVRVDVHRLTGLDAHHPPLRFAAQLLGGAANLVPAYDGPRQGWTALGEILAVLLEDPSVTPADQAWIAALCMRYALIPWHLPAAGVSPALQAQLAAVPPQPPPYWEGGMFPPHMLRALQYQALADAMAAGAWDQVLATVESIQASLAVPEIAAEVPAELAAHGIDLAALEAQVRAEVTQQGATIPSGDALGSS